MTNQRETWRQLLEELRDAAEFDEVLLPGEQGIAGDDAVDVDPLPEVLGRRGVRARLARIAGELLPRKQREHLGVDPLDVRAVLELRDGHVMARRRSFALCVAEMLRRLEFGYSARPPLPEHMFRRRFSPLAVRTAAVSSGSEQGEPTTLAPASGASEATTAGVKANWCVPHPSGLAAWTAAAAQASARATATDDPTAASVPAAPSADAPASATAPGAQRGVTGQADAQRPAQQAGATPAGAQAAGPHILAPGEMLRNEIAYSDGTKVPPSTVQGWIAVGLKLNPNAKNLTKLKVLRKLPNGAQVVSRETVARLVAHSESVQRAKGRAL